MGLWRSKIRERNTPALRCFGCQWYGHVLRVCASSISRCSFCSGPHDGRKYPNPEQLYCANYKGSHGAVDAGCSLRMVGLNRRTTFVTGNISKSPRTPATNSTFQDDTQHPESRVVTHASFRKQKRYTLTGGPASVVSAAFQPGARESFVRVLEGNGTAPPPSCLIQARKSYTIAAAIGTPEVGT